MATTIKLNTGAEMPVIGTCVKSLKCHIRTTLEFHVSALVFLSLLIAAINESHRYVVEQKPIG